MTQNQAKWGSWTESGFKYLFVKINIHREFLVADTDDWENVLHYIESIKNAKLPSKQLLHICVCKLNASFYRSVDNYVRFKKGNRL